MEKLTVIDFHNINALLELTNILNDSEYVAYDTETTGLHKGCEVIGFSVAWSEEQAAYVILAKWDKEQGKLIYPNNEYKAEVINIVNILAGCKLIMHNSVFDCRVSEDFFKIALMPALHTDTMVLAQLLDENRRVGLKELCYEYFGETSTKEQAEMKASIIANGGKITKSEYHLYKADPQLIGMYGAKDALLTYKLFMQLVPELYEQGLDKFFYEEESMPLLRTVTYQLNTVGLKVDTQELVKLQKSLEADCAEAMAFITNETKPHVIERYPGTNKKNGFNINSSAQLAWLLFGKLNLEFGTLTDSGKEVCKFLGLRLPYTRGAKNAFIAACLRAKNEVYHPGGTVNGRKIREKKVKDPWAYIQTDKKTLTKLAPKYKWIERLLDHNRNKKILNTYVEGIQERVQYGTIYPSFLQTGTTSGRYASRNPNAQNMPRNDKRIKKCLISRPGKVFVGADYSQLEPRVFSYFSGDKRLQEVFNGSDDFYSTIGIEVFDKYDALPLKDGHPDAFGIKYKELRELSKVIALASTYGATARQLSDSARRSEDETQEIIDAYFEKFPDVQKMMLDLHKKAKDTGYATSLFGRLRRMPDAKKIAKIYGNTPHAELPYEARNTLNLAVNHVIQSTAASICNRAMIRFTEYAEQAGVEGANIVLQVHDEIVVECNEKDAETVSLLLREAMETTCDLGVVKLEAVPAVAKNLGDLK